ncbi:MAG: glycosyltransferase family 4 protein [Sulfuricaulis sp.]|uniref:glycosyltransferase family 4 protein n=1 Tax=Sulfuricaulis sp. TaxID=2003553 RepID=UPI003C434C93
MKKRRLLFFVTEDWYFCSHRLPLAVAAHAEGAEVTVVTRVRAHGEEIKRHGLRLVPFEIERHGVNPWRELRTVLRLVRVYRLHRPDIVHHVALKPVLYGSIAARFARVPAVINAIAGRGSVFTSRAAWARWLRPILRFGMRRLAGKAKSRIIVQNVDDRDFVVEHLGMRGDHVRLIPGSGVDPNRFVPSPEPKGVPLIVMPCRMLREKGVIEFVEAARILKTEGVAARFALVGAPDESNPANITVGELRTWQELGIVEWWGHRTDMPEVLSQAAIVCLPTSYGEGIPKTLLEAAASARAIVATDVPGCREIARHGENGLLVPVRDTRALAEALKQLILDSSLRQRMGKRGREIAVAEFSVANIVKDTLAVYEELLPRCP